MRLLDYSLLDISPSRLNEPLVFAEDCEDLRACTEEKTLSVVTNGFQKDIVAW